MLKQMPFNGRKETHEMLVRLISFLLVGGFGAVVNLACFSSIYYPMARSLNGLLAYAIAFVMATEVSILVNFILNDHITFRRLHDQHRSWRVRCIRFHITSIGGTLVTLGISFSLLHLLHVPAPLAQSAALVVATTFNFVLHHVYTYRHAVDAAHGRFV